MLYYTATQKNMIMTRKLVSRQLQRVYSKTPLLRPPFVPSKSGLNSGVVLIENPGCCKTFKSDI